MKLRNFLHPPVASCFIGPDIRIVMMLSNCNLASGVSISQFCFRGDFGIFFRHKGEWPVAKATASMHSSCCCSVALRGFKPDFH
jgi:hypothetical protein